ncbi:hypothetical protein BTA51_22520 [Hahella sp. CCB-MM4]|uniref:chemotaxis protein CheW n=1 Tax=Hahella sp. (strain CCB-MM4) TaxID=1926491 RepID=UPI000B9B87EC|nr:chemotaxis protein CheW [Hahella sp. CCB-MM4]OZG71152.1 hypothetical protein BTA51_22520 [Hahella sp. CCB-MM4]
MQEVTEVQLLRFSLDEQSYAIELDSIRKVLRTVAICPIPQAPHAICGVINVQGKLLPVVDLRQKFGLPPRPPHIEDRLIWASCTRLDLLLLVDSVDDVFCTTVSESIANGILPSPSAMLKGIASLPDGILLIHDVSALLNLNEQKELRDAMPDH